MVNILRSIIKTSFPLLVAFSILFLFFSVLQISFFDVFSNLFMGAFGSFSKTANTLRAWIPLVICACGLVFTFKISLWNIGVEGQMIIGAVFGTAALKFLGSELDCVWAYVVVSVIAGFCGGALWGGVVGLLKTSAGVHEIFSGLGLNFLAQSVVLWLVFGPWKRLGGASMSGTELFCKKLWLPEIYIKGFSITGLILLFFVVITIILFFKTTKTGLRLEAVGNNSNAAFLFGLSPQRYMLFAMLISGGLAGIAGVFQVTGVYHRLIPAISSNYGYIALLVVILAGFNVWWICAVSLFFASLNMGSIQLPMIMQVDSSLAGVIQGVIVLAALSVRSFKVKKKFYTKWTS